ncbi:MAG TPA: hypothetical protein VG309_00100 [Rhizomicrobium sp.]|jgi:hypothetical protein|nr:hypothetical protein [Rhizomicrobium sp.]
MASTPDPKHHERKPQQATTNEIDPSNPNDRTRNNQTEAEKPGSNANERSVNK